MQYHVTREAGTERPNTGIYNLENRQGNYHCICCGQLLFTSEMKYSSGCGWPAFHTEHADAGITREPGWLYFVGKDGDVHRAKMARGRK